ncbi:hypothetical protein ACJ72_07332 [Emergomyces africanus]|uniref:Uncharacterized protein n=1 Tax=Emergomyces africanus TaxID=1955775 RepID=A0A1B7NNH7_9EURO|nr:hypothetical protein ACJ72_07332 [Emergomyces africanus]
MALNIFYTVLTANPPPLYGFHNLKKSKHISQKVHAQLIMAMTKFKPTLSTVSELSEPEISSLNYQLLINGKTLSRIERLQFRFQLTKNCSSSVYMDDQVLKLIFENSYLRDEISWYEDYQQALLNLKYVLSYALRTMEEVLSTTTQRLHNVNQSYLKLNRIERQINDESEI